jgi:hypothetical protein
VTVHRNPQWLLVLLEAALIFGFSGYFFRAWHGLSFITRAIFLWGEIAGIIGWVYQLTGSEIIEFSSQKLTIRKDILVWQRIRENRIEDCSALGVHEQSEGDNYALQCKVRWRTIRFGQYLSESQAIEVLTALQRELPDVAQKLGTSTEGKKHFLTLGLSQ